MLLNSNTHMDAVDKALGEYLLHCNAHIASSREQGDVDRHQYWKREFQLTQEARDMLTKRNHSRE